MTDSTTAVTLSFSVLGPLRVEGPTGSIAVPGAKEQALLAHLVARVGQTIPARDLAETIWGDDPPRSAAKALQNHILRLRRCLEPDRVGAAQVVVTDGGGYRLAVDRSTIDACRFERLLDLGRRALRDGRWDAAEATLTDALGLWRGRAFLGLEAVPLLAAEASRLDSMHRAATEDRIAARLELGRAPDVVAELEFLTAQDPLRENAWYLLILALYRARRQAEALAAYGRVREILLEELGVDPSPDLQRLHRQILAQERSLEHHTRTAQLPPALLPPTGVFVGRSPELARLESAWQHVLATGVPAGALLRGVRGIGVSRLAAELAGRAAAAGAPVEHSASAATDPWRQVAAPTLRVVDTRTARTGAAPSPVPGPPVPTAGPVLVVALATPDAVAPRGFEVIDLPPLDEAEAAALAREYVGEDASADEVSELVRTCGGHPARLHEAALNLARRLASAQVRHAAGRVEDAASALGMMRADLRDEVARSALLAESAQPLAPDRCPWPGLAAYGPQDAGAYAGRERLTAELLARVATSRLVAVVGSSGSGKSSLVGAGLVGSLSLGALPGSERWVVLTMRPGAHPSVELARVALRGAEPSADAVAALLERAVFGAAGAGHLVLVIDQLEELWTQCADPDDRGAFLDTLAEVVTGRARITVVLACRADHAGALAEHPVLAGLLPESSVLVGPPTPAELRRAVEHPAARAGLVLDVGLVDALIDDAGAEPGALPLLSTCLAELWERRSGNTLTLAAYTSTDGLSGAVGRVAERAYHRLPAEDREAARVLLLRLTGPGTGSGVTRRRVSLAELRSLPNPRVAATVEPLADARLLSLGADDVEVAHEALFREWPRLRDWLEGDAATRMAQRHLAQAARDWDAGGRDPVELWRGSRLAGGLEVLQRAPDEVTSGERDFLAASRAAQEAQDRQDADRLAATHRQNRRLRWLLGGLVVVLGAALAAGSLAIRSSREADEAARVATARELAAASTGSAATDPELAVLLARRAIATTGDSAPPLPEAVEALHVAVLASRVLRTFADPGVGGAVDWSPDGSYIVTEGPEESGLVQVRDPETGAVVRQWVGHDVDVNDVIIGADGTLATAGDDGAAVAWDPRTGEELGRVEDRRSAVYTPTLSADGSLLAAGMSNAGVIGLVDLGSGASWTVERRGWIGYPSLSPDGSELALARWDDGPGVVEVVDPRSGELRRTMQGAFARYIGALAWSPDGRWIAASGDDAVRVWDARTGGLEDSFSGHTRYTPRVDWAPDSGRVASASHDGTVRVWPVREGSGRALVLSSAAIANGSLGLGFDESGTRVLAGDFATDRAVVFDVGVGGSREWATVQVPDEPVTVQFTPDSRSMVTAGASGGVAVVDSRTGALVGPQPLRRGPQSARVAISPDGTMVAESSTSLIRVLDLDTGRVLAERTLMPDLPRRLAWLPDSSGVAVADPQASETFVLTLAGTPGRPLGEQAGFGPAGVAVSPDGTRLATARAPQGANLNVWGVTIWDAASREPVHELDVRGDDLGFSPDGRTLVVADPSGQAYVVDVATGEVVRTLAGHLGGVTAAAFDAGGGRIATGDGEGRIRLWDATTGTQVAALPGHAAAVTGLAISADGTRLASAGYDGLARVWALDLDDLLSIAERRVTRNLTADECSRYLRAAC